jgi:2-hydroxychromene-2-carboxylate isomerase
LQLGVLDIAAMTKPIESYFDFASPYGFLAAMQIDALPRPLTWRPLLLGAVYKRSGQSPLNHPLKRDYIIKVDVPRMARRIGLDLKVPAGFPEHALPPSRCSTGSSNKARSEQWRSPRSPTASIGSRAALPVTQV